MIEPRNYSLIAPLYDKIFSWPLKEGHLLIADVLAENVNKTFLEVGVGSGLTLEHVTDQNFTGIDISEDMLYVAQQKVLGRHNIQLAEMDAERLSFSNNHFDIVMAPSVLSAVKNPHIVFEEMIRVTRPGGMVIIIAHFNDDNQFISKIFDPLTRSLLGFRMDLELDFFKHHSQLKLIEQKRINYFAHFNLSWFLKFEKQK